MNISCVGECFFFRSSENDFFRSPGPLGYSARFQYLAQLGAQRMIKAKEGTWAFCMLAALGGVAVGVAEGISAIAPLKAKDCLRLF